MIFFFVALQWQKKQREIYMSVTMSNVKFYHKMIKQCLLSQTIANYIDFYIFFWRVVCSIQLNKNQIDKNENEKMNMLIIINVFVTVEYFIYYIFIRYHKI